MSAARNPFPTFGFNRALIASACACAAFLFAACFETRLAEPDKGGNSSETVALVDGKVVDASGYAVAGAWVALVPDDYNPVKGQALPAGLTAVTDAKGHYSLTKVPKGRYGLEAIHPNDGTRLFTEGNELREASETLASGTLRKPGRVRVRLPDYFRLPGGYLFVPHTRFAWPVTGTALEHGYIDMDSLPAASYAAVAFARDTDISVPDTLGRDLDVLPGDTLSVGILAGWKNSSRVNVNTTASGAYIGTDLKGFPMLVRLDAGNFDFTTASSDGSDLRFTKQDGTPIAHQIDHWDAVNKEAAVWVALDSVRGNDSTQYFRMHWGKSGALSRSDGPAVFGVAGFAAVWHLEEERAGTGAADVYRNSAANADHGLDSLSATDQGGVIGNGHLFRNDEYIRIPSATMALKPVRTITLSAWIKPTSTDSGGGEIASMGNDYGIRVSPNGNAYVFSFNVPRSDSTNFLLATTGVNLLDGAWHHFAASINVNHIDIYVDGVLAGSGTDPLGVIRYDGGPDFFIGHHGNGETQFDYTGSIDEVRMMPSIPGEVWLRFAYLTQKPGANAVKIQP
ncbi:MAG: hypothetical protein JWP91_122 [Fibrobacteres bacterium]|nr:hypothetical protein [Fibrobacterota bacterium]